VIAELQALADKPGCRNPRRINRWHWRDVSCPMGHVQGHPVTWDGDEHKLVYADTGETVDWEDLRPCKHCSLPRSPEFDDGCIAKLPDVMFACCGHGLEPAKLSYDCPAVYFEFTPIPIDHPARGPTPAPGPRWPKRASRTK
jgi:hypothetical protein